MKKLKIAIMVTSEIPVPKPKNFKRIYAPLDLAREIAEKMTERGHKVWFFAPKGSWSKKFKLFQTNLTPVYKNKVFNTPQVTPKDKVKIIFLSDQYLLSLMYKIHLKEKFDIFHIHPIERALPFGYLFSQIPIVYTIHDPFFKWRAELIRLFQTKNQYLVAISEAQKKPAPDLNWIGTVYNGITLNKFSFNNTPKNYLLFVGRILKRKGVFEAIQVAKATNHKLLIIGEHYSENEYWQNKIKPNLSKKIQYLGFLPLKKVIYYYKYAKATLMPIQWEEPFGLTFVESMACGTPPITFNRGSAPEVVQNGKTGFIVKNLKEMTNAVKKINQIDRRECRKLVEKKFTTEKMVIEYEKIYYQILNKNRSSK